MNKKVFAAGIIGSVAVIGIAALSANTYAFQENKTGFGPNYTPERHEHMEKAFENNDYAAWKKLMGDRGAARIITAETFPKFAQMHELREAGKNAEADKIREELGLSIGKGEGHGRRNGFVDENKDGVCDRNR